ncbi:S-methyl-5-thioribose-1-phosphate isomerase [Candidatus Poriferisodalis sp.]|uniref:S-methyl-5-thioribose-1-phosphate isomerase n=1 Tax=Candidatus Poriferisodalis sp. TaxID=3101277 RepID=UPI003B522299
MTGSDVGGTIPSPTPTLRWTGDSVEIIDQTRLPAELALIDVRDTATAIGAIERLAIRGAPALGAFGALAVVVGFDEASPRSLDEARSVLERLRTQIGDARPTAVNLRWAVDRTIDAALGDTTLDAAALSATTTSDTAALRERLLVEAQAIGAEDAEACAEIGRLGREVLADATNIATHCNAGRLATAGIGTALATVYAKAAAGEPVRVLASETRPLLQGARLTAWELADASIDVSVVADSAMASLIAAGEVDAVIVGADRIAANGDTANKVGTFAHALAAADAGIGFYVAAPTTTIDPSVPSGTCIVIEQRNPDEVHSAGGRRLTPAGAGAVNPAFDVTPARLITAIITDAGVLRPPYGPSIAAALALTRGAERGAD